MDENRSMKPVKVTQTATTIEAEMLMDLLRNNDIPCFKKDNGPGGLMNVKYGFTVYGQDVYVDEKDYEKASEIIKELSAGQDFEYSDEIENEISDDEDKEEDIYKDDPFFRNPYKLMRVFLISIILISVLIFLFMKFTA